MIRPKTAPIRRWLSFVCILCSFSVTGCAGLGLNNGDGSANLGTPESLYGAAKRALDRGDYLTAIDGFEALGAQFPFGTFTQRAQLEVTFAYFKENEYDNAIAAANRYIKLYPRDASVDYALYMKGLANYSRGGSIGERVFPRNLAQVDQNWLRTSYVEFDTLVRRYPESEYTTDAIERMAFLRDSMAQHELTTARYYYERGAMVASVNRVTYILEQFKESKHVPNALALMASAQRSLGQDELAKDTLRVLSETDPTHPALVRL